MTANADEAAARPAPPPAPVRQRWRIVYRRTETAAELAQRALETAWLAALEASGLPIAPTGPGSARPKAVFGPPIPVGAVGDQELLDVYLRERVALAEVEERLRPVVPAGCELLEVHDVWVGAPALPAAVVAVDYRVEIAVEPAVLPGALDLLRGAAATMLEARTLPRTRARGGRVRDYDLRPMLLDLRVVQLAEDRLGVAMRLRVDPAAGAGRPDEVVRALLEAVADGAPPGTGGAAGERAGGGRAAAAEDRVLEALRRATADWLGPATAAVVPAPRPGDEVGDATAEPPPSPTDGAVARAGSAGKAVRVVRERCVTADEADAPSPAGTAPT
jgi:radical SAM-linked protein